MTAMPQQRVPFLDLHSQIAPLRKELDQALARVLDSCGFVLGEDVAAFEREFAAFCEARHCIGVDSGTSALHLVLRGLDIGPGSEVIVPANSFIATAEAVSLAGATPVFADVEPGTGLLDPHRLGAAIGPRTRAIIPVHLYGRTADLEPILAIAAGHGVQVIEDAAQAHGARYHGRRIGGHGIAAAFSFYPGKNLGAFGDAGAITTNDDRLATTLRELRDHGQERKYEHRRIGTNARLDSIQAAVLRIKLAHLERWNAARRRHAALYDTLLRGTEFTTPAPLRAGEDHVYHLYVVRHPNRAAVVDALRQGGIGFGLHYPVPIHRSPAYAALAYGAGSLPVAEQLADEIVSLPMFAELSEDQVRLVCDVLTQATVSG
jgi:dTDP-4-amino-4,6-dideoxygalactose transaminase